MRDSERAVDRTTAVAESTPVENRPDPAAPRELAKAPADARVDVLTAQVHSSLISWMGAHAIVSHIPLTSRGGKTAEAMTCGTQM
jgi:hypothetical protein